MTLISGVITMWVHQEANTLRAQIIRIGNSRGVRIPKPLLEEAGLENEVDISVERDALVIRPVGTARAGWDEAFRGMATAGDDALLDAEAPTGSSWDDAEWEWS